MGNIFSDRFPSPVTPLTDLAEEGGSSPNTARVPPISSVAAGPALLASLPYFGSAHNILGFEVSDSCWQAWPYAVFTF